MTQRSKNLLEAFNASRAVEKTPASPAAPRSALAKLEGPRAEPAAPALGLPLSDRSGRERELAMWRQAAIYIGIAIVFFLLGRVTGGGPSTAASEPGATPRQAASTPAVNPAPSQPTPPAKTSTAATVQTAAEKALADKTNQYTILAVQYDYSENAQRIASEASQHLAGQGFPACLYRRGKNLFLMVGASPRIVELDPLLSQVRALPGPGGRPGDFKTAFVDKIDKYVER